MWQTLLDAHPTALGGTSLTHCYWSPNFVQVFSFPFDKGNSVSTLMPGFASGLASASLRLLPLSVRGPNQWFSRNLVGVGIGSKKGVLYNKKSLEEEMPFLFAGHHSFWAQEGGVIDTLMMAKQKGWKVPESLKRSLSCWIIQPLPHLTARPLVWCDDKSPIV